jgi:RNA polymerase sigma factor (sigma-70 family)
VITDAEVIQRSLQAPDAFGEIFERHHEAVARYSRRRLGAPAGEDIAAQAFVVAFERRARFDVRYETARPWLLGITANLIRHHLRDERVHASALERAPLDPAPAPIDDPGRIDAARLRPALTAALLALSDDDRETFLLVALGEISYQEAATALGIPVGTVRSRMYRARRALRERLDDLEAMTDER